MDGIEWKAILAIVGIIMGTIFFGFVAQYALQSGELDVKLLISLYLNFLQMVAGWYLASQMAAVAVKSRALKLLKALIVGSAAAIAFIVGLLVANFI